MIDLSGFFQLTPLPSNRLSGYYNLGLVAISYGMAFFASYIALDFAGRLRLEPRQKIKRYWLMGGALSMGAGIWSMHFIGMLAFILPIPMHYDPFWTISSLVAAVISAGFSLFLLRNKTSSITYLSAGGVVLGLAIATMHYMGMAGMMGMTIHYLPGLFIASIIIAIVASEIALFLTINSTEGSLSKQIRLKIMSALIMGAAIFGMHYTGMAAAIFTPLHLHSMIKSIDYFSLSLYIACITGGILTIALIVSTYKQIMVNTVQNERNFLNAVLNNLSDGVLACDSDGQVMVANPAFKRLINVGDVNYLDKAWLDQCFFYPFNQDKPIPASDRPIIRALRGERFEGLELDIQLKDNKNRRNVLVSGQPILNSHDEKLGAVITILDITVQKQADQKLETINQELDAFTYSVAHDLKSPLRAIDGFSKILSDNYSGKLDEEGQRLLSIICANSKKMRKLIDDLLDFSHISRHDIKKENVSMQQLVNDIYSELMVVIPNREIVFDLKELPDIRADQSLMHQVWANLLSNAIKFTQNTAHAQIEVGSLVDGSNWITYYVKDNGLGFDMKYADKLFGVFQRLHSQDIEGTGIGLANVKQIITRHGGTVRGEGKLGFGARFYFTLPRAVAFK